MSVPHAKLPAWAEYGLIPLVNLAVAFLISGLVVLIVGESPLEAAYHMINGAFGRGEYIGFTLYYTTTFIFTGLAVAVAFHCGLFNIGSEGQAYIGGIGVALACLAFDRTLPWYLVFPIAILGAGFFGALWALIPGWLQAKRGSHIVITTIMFNFIAAAFLNWALVKWLRPVGSMDPASANFPPSTHLPKITDMFARFGIEWGKHTPANVTFLIALLACVAVWVLIWRTKLGYEIRAFGKSDSAARYAGISPVKITVITMLISGGLAGLMAINNVMGEAERLILNNVEGAGFIGIAVALMGRNHPVGVLLAALLFGFLYQGGGELALWTSIPRELIIVIQALVILFTGALDNMVRMPLERFFTARRLRKRAMPVTTNRT